MKLPTEKIAWESMTPCYTRYITDTKYNKISPNAQKWYRPYQEFIMPSDEQLMKIVMNFEYDVRGVNLITGTTNWALALGKYVAEHIKAINKRTGKVEACKRDKIIKNEIRDVHEGWLCTRDKGHEGPCAMQFVFERKPDEA